MKDLKHSNVNDNQRAFLLQKSTRPKLDDVLIVRIDPHLRQRVDAVRRGSSFPPMTRSEFTRRALNMIAETFEAGRPK